jgi:hypothetical protein
MQSPGSTDIQRSNEGINTHVISIIADNVFTDIRRYQDTVYRSSHRRLYRAYSNMNRCTDLY